MQPIPMTAMTPQTPLPLPMYPPGVFGFGQQMYPPDGFRQQMFYGQTAPTLFLPEVITFLVLIMLLLV